MAHGIHKKAAVVAALMLGAGVRETARNFDIPVSTVSRWRKSEALPRMREIGRRHPELAELGRRLLALKMEHKKRNSVPKVSKL